MKPFNFRLETLLEYRKIQKEQSQIAFLQASNQLRSEKELLVELKGKLGENITLFNTRQQQPLTIDILNSFQYYFDKINRDIDKQNQCVIQADEQRESCLQALAEAEKNYKIVEKFREKKIQQYQIEAIKEEQKNLDEIGLQIYTREK